MVKGSMTHFKALGMGVRKKWVHYGHKMLVIRLVIVLKDTISP